MKIIDERGRLFGKINVIDFLVILFLLCILPMFYFGYKILSTRGLILHEKPSFTLETDCRLIEIKPEVLKLISVGDKEVDKTGQIVGEIVEIGASAPYRQEFDIGEGRKIVQQTTNLKQLKVKLKLEVQAREDDLYYKGRVVRVNSLLEFSTDKYTLPFVIPEEEKILTDIETDCRLIEIKPEVLKLISVGDKEVDKTGQIVGEIVEIGASAPYRQEFDIGEGRKIVQQTTNLKQLKVKLKLEVQAREDDLYYKGRVVRSGLPLQFSTDKYSLKAIPFQIREQERMIDLFVTLKSLDDDTLKKLSVGDKELDENGRTIAEILTLGKIENSSLTFNLGKGNFVIGEDSDKKQIFTKMRLKCQTGEFGQLYIKGRKTEYNTSIEFETDEYKVQGIVAETFKAFEMPSPIKKKWISLRVKLIGLSPEISRTIEEGDIEKDAFGKIVARISKIISNSPSQVLTIREGEFFSLEHPFQSDILICLEVLCVEKEDSYYFKNYPAKMGNIIVFATELYSISGTIVGMETR